MACLQPFITKGVHKGVKGGCGVLVFDLLPLMTFDPTYGGNATSFIVTTLSRLDNKFIRLVLVPYYTGSKGRSRRIEVYL